LSLENPVAAFVREVPHPYSNMYRDSHPADMVDTDTGSASRCLCDQESKAGRRHGTICDENTVTLDSGLDILRIMTLLHVRVNENNR